jgi:hypothetical protein
LLVNEGKYLVAVFRHLDVGLRGVSEPIGRRGNSTVEAVEGRLEEAGHRCLAPGGLLLGESGAQRGLEASPCPLYQGPHD